MEALSADLRRLRQLYDALDEPPTEKLAGICRRFCNPNSRLVYPSHRREKKKRMILDTIEKLEKNLDMQEPAVPEIEDTKWPEDCSPFLRGWQVVDESNSFIDGNSVDGRQRGQFYCSSDFSLEYKDITTSSENQESGSGITDRQVSRNRIWWREDGTFENDKHFSEEEEAFDKSSEAFHLIEEVPQMTKAINTSKDEVLQETLVAELASSNAEKEVLLLKGVVVDALEQQGNRKCPEAEQPRLAIEIETLVSPQVKHELVVLNEKPNILGDSGGKHPELKEFMTVLEALISEVEIQQKLFDSVIVPQHKDAEDLTHSGSVGPMASSTLDSVLDLISDIAKQLEALPRMEVTDSRIEVLDFQMRQLEKVHNESLNVQECKGSVCRHGLLALFQMFLLFLGILLVFCEFSDRIRVAVPT